MIGTWAINVVFGFIGFMSVFVSAFTTNSFTTSVIRGSIAFVSFFLIGYLIRWVIFFIIKDPEGKTTINSQLSGSQEDKDMKDVNNHSINELQSSIYSLNEEEAKLASQYIKELLNQKEEKR